MLMTGPFWVTIPNAKLDKANSNKNRARESESVLLVHINKMLQETFINWINLSSYLANFQTQTNVF